MVNITILATKAFDALERVRALEMMNTPQEYGERRQAFIDLARARQKAYELQRELDEAVKGGV